MNHNDVVKTPKEIQKQITDLMKQEIAGGEKTGFSPYIQDGEILFDHRWLLLIGIKESIG